MEHGIAGWTRRVAAPPGDGTHLVIGHDGMKLLPLDAGPGMVVLTFIQRGEVIRRGALGEVMGDLPNLQRSVSHLNWGSDLYAGVRSTLNTGRRQGLSAFQAIQAAINGQPILGPGGVVTLVVPRTK